MMKLLLVLSILVSLSLAWPKENINDEIGGLQEKSEPEDISHENSGKELVREKRFLWSLFGAGVGNYRICGYNFYGTPIYTNGFLVTCTGRYCDGNSNFFCRD